MEYDTPIRAADIFVGAEDRPYDGIDQNCDGLDDFDQDGDGFIPNEYVGVATLGLVETGQLPGGDCDDDDALRHPDTEEVCDGVINGCDATLPEVEVDGDGDGFVQCTVVDEGWQGDEVVEGGDDCDDEDPILFPTQKWYGDSDSDGFGEAGDVRASCTQPSGYVLNSDDCDDTDATIYPEAPEICDGLVNACVMVFYPKMKLTMMEMATSNVPLMWMDGTVIMLSSVVMIVPMRMVRYSFHRRTTSMRMLTDLERRIRR